MIVVTVLAVVSGGGLFFLAEPESVGGFWTGVWWAVVTATTVGYGDIAPATLTGRLVGVALMIIGISLFATLGDPSPHTSSNPTRTTGWPVSKSGWAASKSR